MLKKAAGGDSKKLAQLPAVCNSLGIKIDPNIIHMSISGAKIN